MYFPALILQEVARNRKAKRSGHGVEWRGTVWDGEMSVCCVRFFSCSFGFTREGMEEIRAGIANQTYIFCGKHVEKKNLVQSKMQHVDIGEDGVRLVITSPI